MKRRIGLLGNKLMTEIDSESELNKNEIGISLDQNKEISGVQVLDENRKISSIYKKFDINRYKVYLVASNDSAESFTYFDITSLVYLNNKYENDFYTQSIHSKVMKEYEKNPNMLDMYIKYTDVKDTSGYGKIGIYFNFIIVDTFKYNSVEQYMKDLLSNPNNYGYLIISIVLGRTKQNIIYRDLPDITFPIIYYNGNEIKIQYDNISSDEILNTYILYGDLSEKTFDTSQNSEVLVAGMNLSNFTFSDESRTEIYEMELPTVKIKLLITPNDLDENGKLK